MPGMSLTGGPAGDKPGLNCVIPGLTWGILGHIIGITEHILVGLIKFKVGPIVGGETPLETDGTLLCFSLAGIDD